MPTQRQIHWREILLWGAGLLVAMGGLWAVMRQAAETELDHAAADVAVHWARLAASTVPDLDEALAGRGLSAAAHQQLLALSGDAEVFRFKLFSASGRTILSSDELATAPAAAIGLLRSAADTVHIGVPAEALQGRPVVTLKRSDRADRPAVFSEAYVPILRDGRSIGLVEVYIDQRQRALRTEAAFARVGLLAALLLVVPAALAFWRWAARLQRQQRAEEQASYLASHDALSGVLNRATFNTAVEQAGRRRAQGGPGFAVMCIDLDHFKDINDAQGHAAGDEVLRQVGARLQALVRKGDEVARIGGDEFALLQGGVATPQDTTTLAQRVVDALGAPYDFDGQTVVCGASVGLAIFGVDAQTTTELMHKADLALYRAKAAGRGNFSFYDATLDAQLQQRRELTRDLRDAIGTDALALHYQPLYARDGRTLNGYEALLRWRHPQRGNVPPVDFIPLAEDSGLIDPLGRWVLQTACLEAARWPQPLRVSVNLSAAQFQRGDVAAIVADTLAGAGLAPDRLELEITESLLMGNTEPVVAVLQKLSAMGVRIAMDDFGTGYSSLSYLWRFPFDKLKIDRAFTQGLGVDPKVTLIVRSIISLAHSLKIRVNAEGVETAAQMALLREHGCDELQGFLLGRPVPVDALPHVAAAEAPGTPELRPAQV